MKFLTQVVKNQARKDVIYRTLVEDICQVFEAPEALVKFEKLIAQKSFVKKPVEEVKEAVLQ